MNYNASYSNTINGIMNEYFEYLKNKSKNYEIRTINDNTIIYFKEKKLGSFCSNEKQISFTINEESFYKGKIEDESKFYSFDLDINNINEFAKKVSNTENPIIMFKRTLNKYFLLEKLESQFQSFKETLKENLISFSINKFDENFLNKVNLETPYYIPLNVIYKNPLDETILLNVVNVLDKEANLKTIEYDTMNLNYINTCEKKDILSYYKKIDSLDILAKKILDENKINQEINSIKDL